MTRFPIVLLLCALLTLFSEQAVADGRRVALVVGVGEYATVPRLPNAVNDATAMAELLRKAGFDVVTARSDVGNLEFKRAIRDFEESVADADIALVFYAGHGIEVREQNYLIPADAKLVNERDVEDEAIGLDRLITALEPAKRLRLIILDACRDNPFAGKMRRRVATRAIAPGLGKVEPPTSDTLIAYAAKERSVANDGDGDHSPFTTALLNNLTIPGLDVRIAFGRVRDEVMKATNRQQEPFVYGSLGGGNVALVPAVEAALAAARGGPVDPAKADYELVERLSKKEAWQAFLKTHTTGLYADLARVQLAKLSETNALTAIDAPSRATDPAVPPTGARPPMPAVIVEPRATTVEQKAWDKLTGSTDINALRKFIERFPSSPLLGEARRRVEILEQLVREQEEAARVQREAARQREIEEKALRAAEMEHKRLEREAVAKREAEEKARILEAERAKAEAAAALKQREAEERVRAAIEQARRLAEEERAKAAEIAARRKEAEERAQALAAERAKAEQESAARKREIEEANRAAAAAKAVREAEERERARLAQEADRKERALAAERAKAEQEAAARVKAAEIAARQKADAERAQALAAERAKAEQDVAARKREIEEANKAAAAAKAVREAEERERTRLAQEADRKERERAAERAKAEQEAAARVKAAEAERKKAEQAAVAQRRRDEDAARAAIAEQSKAKADTEAENRRLAEAEKAAAARKAERAAAAKQRETLEESRRVAEEAAANRRKAADVARRAAERQAEQEAAADDKRRRAARLAKEVTRLRAAQARPVAQPAPRAEVAPVRAPAPSYGPAEIGAARMMSRMP